MENDNHGNGYALKFLADMKAKYAALGDAIASVEKALNIGALGGLGIGGEATFATWIRISPLRLSLCPFRAAHFSGSQLPIPSGST